MSNLETVLFPEAGRVKWAARQWAGGHTIHAASLGGGAYFAIGDFAGFHLPEMAKRECLEPRPAAVFAFQHGEPVHGARSAWTYPYTAGRYWCDWYDATSIVRTLANATVS